MSTLNAELAELAREKAGKDEWTDRLSNEIREVETQIKRQQHRCVLAASVGLLLPVRQGRQLVVGSDWGNTALPWMRVGQPAHTSRWRRRPI